MNTFDLARAFERGACGECTTPRRVVFHYRDSGCPWRRRLNAVPCKRLGCGAMTFRDDGCCSDLCAVEYVRRCELAAASRVGANAETAQ